jgi:hypothetical protein
MVGRGRGIQWVAAASEWWALRGAATRDAVGGATMGALIAADIYAVSLVARGCRSV